MKNRKNVSAPRVTLRDIAKATGFSVNTISHALKDKDDISEKNKQIIQQSAKEMGYIADSIAGSLRSGVTCTIAVILGDIFNPLFGLWVRVIETEAYKNGYSTLIMNTDEDATIEYNAITTAIGKRVDGIIICPTQKNDESLELLHKSGIPYVLIGRRYEDPSIDYVVHNDVQGGLIATRHLLEVGHKRILFLNGPSHISSARDRLEGYRKAYEEASVPIDPALICTVGVRSGECGKILEHIIEQHVPFTAILAFSDIVALETLNELRRFGGNFLKIPVIGFDDILAVLSLPLSLTSIASTEGSAASWAVDILMQRMEQKFRHQKQTEHKHVMLDVKIVHRN